MRWKPQDDYQPPPEGGGSKEIDKAGTYLMAFVYCHGRDVSRNGTDFIRYKASVIGDGPMKGRVVWEDVFLSVKARRRLSSYMMSMGMDLSREYDPDGEAFRRLLLRRPFKASVEIEHFDKRDGTRGKKPRIKYPKEEVSNAERVVMDEWLASHARDDDGADDPQKDEDWDPDQYEDDERPRSSASAREAAERKRRELEDEEPEKRRDEEDDIPFDRAA